MNKAKLYRGFYKQTILKNYVPYHLRDYSSCNNVRRVGNFHNFHALTCMNCAQKKSLRKGEWTGLKPLPFEVVLKSWTRLPSLEMLIFIIFIFFCLPARIPIGCSNIERFRERILEGTVNERSSWRWSLATPGVDATQHWRWLPLFAPAAVHLQGGRPLGFRERKVWKSLNCEKILQSWFNIWKIFTTCILSFFILITWDLLGIWSWSTDQLYYDVGFSKYIKNSRLIGNYQ
jgi:hypothetical protein